MSDVSDLTFVTTDELVRELLTRCHVCVVAAQFHITESTMTLYTTPYPETKPVCEGWLSAEMDLLRAAGHRVAVLNQGLAKKRTEPERNT
jgi:hypothetical protein